MTRAPGCAPLVEGVSARLLRLQGVLRRGTAVQVDSPIRLTPRVETAWFQLVESTVLSSRRFQNVNLPPYNADDSKGPAADNERGDDMALATMSAAEYWRFLVDMNVIGKSFTKAGTGWLAVDNSFFLVEPPSPLGTLTSRVIRLLPHTRLRPKKGVIRHHYPLHQGFS